MTIVSSSQDLPIVRVSDTHEELFVGADGRAVWPVRTADEMNALSRMAQLFGARLNEVSATAGCTVAGSELVVGLGEDIEEAARLYAHLTNRQYRIAASPSALLLGDLPSVVVTKRSCLTSHLLGELYSRGEGEPIPGIVLATAPVMMRRQVLLRAAATVFQGPLETIRTDIIPYVRGVGDLRGQGARVVGGSVSPSVLEAAMRDNAGVISITTKADGVDASLGSERLLCAMDRPPLWARGELDPRCHATGMCHRLGMPMPEALASGKLLSPDSIRTRVLVWNVCWGLGPPEHVIDPAWGLGFRLVDSPTVGAVMTSWQVTITSPEYGMQLTDYVAGGLSVGEAVGRFNQLEHCRGTHQRMCLLGDPRVRLPVPIITPAPERKAKPVARSAQRRGLLEISLLRACAARAEVNSWGQASVPELARAAADAIARYEMAAWQVSAASEEDGSACALMQRSVLSLVLRRGRLFDDWVPFAASLRPKEPSAPCFACGSQPNTTIARLRIPGVSPRRLSNCPHCSAISDVPADCDLGLSVLPGGRLRLSGSLPEAEWAAGLCLTSSLPSDSITLEWPSAPDGKPAETIDLPEPWPNGPLRLSVVVLRGASISFFTRMMRRQQDHSGSPD